MRKFLAGIAFATVGLAFLDAISVSIASLTEVFKGKCAVKVSDMNKKILDSDNDEKSNTQAIGFTVFEEEDDDYED